jgi:hypothetical protein
LTDFDAEQFNKPEFKLEFSEEEKAILKSLNEILERSRVSDKFEKTDSTDNFLTYISLGMMLIACAYYFLRSKNQIQPIPKKKKNN